MEARLSEKFFGCSPPIPKFLSRVGIHGFSAEMVIDYIRHVYHVFYCHYGQSGYHVFYCRFRQSVMSNLRQIFETQTMSRSVDQLGWDTSYLMCGQIRKWKSPFPFDSLMIINSYHKKAFWVYCVGGQIGNFRSPKSKSGHFS